MNIELHRTRAHFSVRLTPPVDAVPPASLEPLRIRLYLALIVVDLCCILLAFIVASVARYGVLLEPQALQLVLVTVPIYLVFGVNGRAYTMDVLIASRTGARRALTSFLFAVAAVLFVGFCLQVSMGVSRLLFGVGSTLAAILLIAGRGVFGRLTRPLLGASPLCEVLIQDGVTAPVGPDTHVFDAHEIGVWPDTSDPLMMDRLGRLLRHADRVVVACRSEERSAWAMALKGANIAGEVLVPEIDTLGVLGTGHFGGCTTLQVACGPLGLRERVIKRLMDVTLAAGAIVLLAPLLIAVAIAIKLDSAGPVFFVQKRLGQGNRLFTMYKYRSMKVDRCDSDGRQSTRRDDDRITRVGRVIRGTSIDELPQILNVLIGDMSFVGPRPHALGSTAGNKLFWEVDSRYWHRHASKPGITGLAQIRGFRGATNSASDLTNRLQADLEYSAGWTIWRDVSILFATFKVIIHQNAF